MTCTMQGSFSGANVETHKIALTGTTAIEISTKFQAIYGYSWAWAEEPDNPPYQVYTSDITANVLSLKCTHATTKEIYVTVFGRP